MFRMNSYSAQPFVPLDSTFKTIALFSQPYLDTYNQCYTTIVVANQRPKGPLNDIVMYTQFPPLSEFKQSTPCNKIKTCGLALRSIEGTNCCQKNGSNLMVVDEIPTLMSYLLSNGYSINTSITKMFNTSEVRINTDLGNKLICYITYNE